MKRSVISITLTLAILAFVLPGCGPYADEGPDRDSLGGFHKAVLTDAPEVPPPTDYSTTQKVIVRLEIVEKIMRLADGVERSEARRDGKAWCSRCSSRCSPDH